MLLREIFVNLFCSYTILNISFKGLNSYIHLFDLHDRENEIWNEGVILLLVPLIFYIILSQ